MRKLSRWFHSPAHLAFAGLFAAGLATLLVNGIRLWIFTIDDSFITFRYSAHLVGGLGPTFNPSGLRAEGYTSVLWMLIMAVPHLAGFGVVSFSKLAGLLSMTGVMALMAVFLRLAGRSENRPYHAAAAGLVILFLGLLPETAVHAVSGMETALYTLCLTGLVTLAYLAIGNGGRPAQAWARDWLPLAALLAGLARPEANLSAVLVLGFVFAAQPAAKRKQFGLRVLLLYVLPGALYFTWRWSYFGVLLPLPFYIKAGSGGPVGWPYVRAFVIFVLANLGVYLGLGLLGERRAVGLILTTVLANLGFFVFSYHMMGYDYRFLYPLLPLLLVLAGMGLALLFEQAAAWSRAARRPWLAPAWIGLLALVMLAAQNLPRADALFESKLSYARGMLRNHVAIGLTLNEALHDTERPVLVVSDAGAIPYYAEWNTIDVVGLNDPQIALGRVQPETYVFAADPEVVIMMSNNPQVFESDAASVHELYRLSIAHGLEVVARSPFYRQDTMWVLARPGGEAARLLRDRFHPGE